MTDMKNSWLAIVIGTLIPGPVAAALAPDSAVNVSTVTVSTATSANNGACQEGTTNCSAKPSWEQELETAKSSWGACQDDVNKFCEGVQVGEGRIEKCLKNHRSKLSKKCRQAQGLK